LETRNRNNAIINKQELMERSYWWNQRAQTTISDSIIWRYAQT